MMRLSASRNQRSKGGFRLKLVLQICLLLAICTWLIYQVKHSHDKKRAFEDKISKFASKATSKEPDLFDVGRKGLPFVKENDSISNTDADNEEEEERDHDLNMIKGEAKHEEGKRVGEDNIDELDQDRVDEENEQEEEFFSEEEKDGHAEEDGLFDNKEEGEDSAQEAREENYKRDDASSAVAHDSSMETEEDSKAVAVNGSVDGAISIKNETLGYVAPIRINNETMGYVAPIRINNETMGYVAPISNVSNVSFGENMTVTNADLSINGSLSTEVKNQNELSLHENNVSNSNPLAIQNDSVSNTQISQPGSSIPVQDQNHNSNAIEGHELDDHHLGLTTNKNENGTTIRSDPLTVPVIQNEVKDTNDKAAG